MPGLVRVVLREDPTSWLLVLWAGLLIVVMVGVLLATRQQRRRGPLGTAAALLIGAKALPSSTSCAGRLSDSVKRISVCGAFGRVVERLQQEAGQISGKSLGLKSETTKPRRDSGITRGSEVWEANGRSAPKRQI